MKRKYCTSPRCEGVSLVKSEMESSLSIERWECPLCGKGYSCPTALASTAQLATVASALSIAAGFALHLLGMDWATTMDHIEDNIDGFAG